jgi:arsenate reductase
MTRIAFVCVHNAGRSQMAAAFARKMAPPGVAVLSGGTEPAARLNPSVIAAMAEKGIDISGEAPRRLTFEEAMSADYFITMGCSPEDACPAGYRGDTRDWALEDPKGKPMEVVRAIRDEIERRVKALLVEIQARPTTGRPKGGSA